MQGETGGGADLNQGWDRTTAVPSHGEVAANPELVKLVIGLEHSDLSATFDRVRAGHPEVALAAVPNPPPSRLFSSDHYNFARRGVSILKFGGPNPGSTDYHKVGDSPDKIEVEREAKILRFAFYLGQEVANTDARPQWNPESYEKIVKE